MVFICFSSTNRYDVVKSCLYHLQRYGLKVWYDYHELVLGDNKERKNFQYAIDNSKYFIIIYSKDFFFSPSALHEETLIFKRKAKENIAIFPILYNITIEDLPENYRGKISMFIYNEISDENGTLNAINQIVCRILLDEYNVQENERTPTLGALKPNPYWDDYIKTLFEHYKKIDPENFNARATLLFCFFSYLTVQIKEDIPTEYYHTMQYLSDYTKFNIKYNHKELTIMELIILLLLRDLK